MTVQLRQVQGAESASHAAPLKLLEEITEPGAYICRDSGDLVRVTQSDAPSDDMELLKRQGTELVYVTQLSRDPFMPISLARIAAANLDMEINF